MTFAQLSAGDRAVRRACSSWRVPTRRGIRVAIGAARGDLRGDGRAVLGQRLRWRDLGGARLRAARVDAARSRAARGGRCGCSRASWSPAASSSAWSTSCARPTSARTSASSSRRRAPTSTSATLVIRRKAVGEPLGARPIRCSSAASSWSRCSSLYLWLVPPKSLAPLVARVIPTAEATALALAVVAVLGFALNDSGITIPGMMAAVFLSALVIVLCASGVQRRPEPFVTVVVATARRAGDGAVPADRERRDPRRHPRSNAQNYRGHTLATAGGIFIILSVLVIDAGRSVLGALGVGARGRAHARRAWRCCSRCSGSASSA